MPASRFVVLGLGVALSVAAAADIYKWVDADGHVTYSDLPPKDSSQVAEVFPAPSPQTLAAQQASEFGTLTERLERLANELADARRAAEASRLAAAPPVMPAPPPWNACEAGDPSCAGFGAPPAFASGVYAPAPLIVGVPFVHHRFHQGRRHFPPRFGLPHATMKPHAGAVLHLRSGDGLHHRHPGAAMRFGKRR